MPIGPEDETPPHGLRAVRTEAPTDRPFPTDWIRCPECQGEYARLTVAERNADGSVAKAYMSRCEFCLENPGIVSRADWAKWHARREGRP